MVLGNLLYWKPFWAEGSTKLDHAQMCLPTSIILWLEGVVFCLACNFLQKYSHTSQSCKTRPRVLFSHAHFVQCWPQGTEACQIGEARRDTQILHRMCRSHQGKHNSPHYLWRVTNTQRAAKWAAELWQMCCVLLWDLQVPQGCCASFCSSRDLEQIEQGWCGSSGGLRRAASRIQNPLISYILLKHWWVALRLQFSVSHSGGLTYLNRYRNR